MKLTDHLPRELVKVPLPAADKTEAITHLVDLLAEHGYTDKRDEVLRDVLDREAQRTTGIGRGFAIPHAKCDSVDKLTIAFGRPSQPIDFGAIDGKPVSLIALLVSPTNETSTHIEALAKLSHLVSNGQVLDDLLSAQDADAAYNIITNSEQTN